MMIFVRKSDSVVVASCLEEELVSFTEEELVLRSGLKMKIGSAKYSAISGCTLPDGFRPSAFTYEDTVFARFDFSREREQSFAQTKALAERKILNIMPIHVQRNTTARGAELALAGLSRALTSEEQAEIAAGQALWDRIKAIRAYSNQLEAQLDAATTIEEFDAIDITAGWPE